MQQDQVRDVKMNHETSGNYKRAAICDKLQKKFGKLLTRVLAHFDANLLNSLEYSSIFS